MIKNFDHLLNDFRISNNTKDNFDYFKNFMYKLKECFIKL